MLGPGGGQKVNILRDGLEALGNELLGCEHYNCCACVCECAYVCVCVCELTVIPLALIFQIEK